MHKNNYAMIVSELSRPYDAQDHSSRSTQDGAGCATVGRYAALAGAALEGQYVS